MTVNTEAFRRVIDRQFKLSYDTLVKKAAEYADGFTEDDDKLQNFRKAAHLQGVSMLEALGGMMAKHTVSIFDMLQQPERFPLEVWEEKITDHINYLVLLKAILAEAAIANVESHQQFQPPEGTEALYTSRDTSLFPHTNLMAVPSSNGRPEQKDDEQ